MNRDRHTEKEGKNRDSQKQEGIDKGRQKGRNRNRKEGRKKQRQIQIGYRKEGWDRGRQEGSDVAEVDKQLRSTKQKRRNSKDEQR